MIEPSERQLILSRIGLVAERDLAALWAKASALSSDEFRAYMLEAFPALVDPFAAAAADAAAVWYDETPSTTNYIPEPGPLPLAEQLTTSAAWALGATGVAAIPRLEGVLSRAVFDAARDTVLHNIESEPGAKWARHASSNACAFCAMMATRGAVYSSKAAAETVVGRGKAMTAEELKVRLAGGTRIDGRTAAAGVKTRGTQELGKKYHDKCHCIAVEIRPGQKYQPPDYVQQWEEAYRDAMRKASKDAVEAQKRGEDVTNTGTSAVLANMRAALGTH